MKVINYEGEQRKTNLKQRQLFLHLADINSYI